MITAAIWCVTMFNHTLKMEASYTKLHCLASQKDSNIHKLVTTILNKLSVNSSKRKSCDFLKRDRKAA
jgi:hypothetical protein